MKRILIVDDAIELGRLFHQALKSTHPEVMVTVVPSAEEALLESTRLSFDLLVTDIRLPGMSGLDLIRKIRVRQPNVRVMVITGISLDERLKKQKDDLNPDIFMRKPISVTEFIDTVDQLLGFAEGEGRSLPQPAGVTEGKLNVKAPLPVVPALGEVQAAAQKPCVEAPAHKAAPNPSQAALLDELAGVFPGQPVAAAGKTALPKKGTGKLTLPPAPSPAEEGLSGILSRLRGTLGAVSAILLDDRGHPVAQAGDLPDLALESQLVPPMMATLSAGAKISYLLGQSSSQMVQAYRGTSVDLVIAPVGQYALLMALKSGRSALRLALTFEEALQAQAELSTVLESMGLHVQSVAEVGAPEVLLAGLGGGEAATEAEIPSEILETPLGQDPGLEKFEALFAEKKTNQLGLQDADSFWDMASNEEKPDVSTSGVLSFEQAQKLGLLPPEE